PAPRWTRPQGGHSTPRHNAPPPTPPRVAAPRRARRKRGSVFGHGRTPEDPPPTGWRRAGRVTFRFGTVRGRRWAAGRRARGVPGGRKEPSVTRVDGTGTPRRPTISATGAPPPKAPPPPPPPPHPPPPRPLPPH